MSWLTHYPAIFMTAILIPFRSVHFSIPQALIMQCLRIIIDNEIAYSLERITNDDQFATFTLSINLTKEDQRNAVIQVEQILVASSISDTKTRKDEHQ